MESIKFTEEQAKVYREQFAPKATDAQWAYFRAECERRGLIPGVHVVFQLRNVEEFDAQLQRKVNVQKVTLITTINALRLIAERSGKFRGYGVFQYYYKQDKPGESPFVAFAVPLGTVPHAVSVALYREGWPQPVVAFARYEACVQLHNGVPTKMWHKRGEEQLAKCAEADGLRKIAPEECGDLYITEEMESSDPVVAEITPATAKVELPAATVAPVVNQAPAQVDQPIEEKPAAPESKPAPAPAPAAPKKPSTPPRPAGPRPTPAAPQKPATETATTAPAPVVEQTRQATPEGNTNETVKELNEFADRVARDKDPEPNIHGVVITDADLPENLQPQEKPADPTPATSPAPVADSPAQPATVAQPAAPAPTVSDLPTSSEYQVFMTRAAKILRDKLEKEGKLKGASQLLQTYIMKQGGAPKLNKIPKATFEQIIGGLENATVEQAVTMVKGE